MATYGEDISAVLVFAAWLWMVRTIGRKYVIEDEQQPDETPEQFRRRHEHHHEHAPTQEELELAAYLNWCESGKPYFDASITFANWLDAVEAFENADEHHPHRVAQSVGAVSNGRLASSLERL